MAVLWDHQSKSSDCPESSRRLNQHTIESEFVDVFTEELADRANGPNPVRRRGISN
jgi:hypothetical protein